jgi:hypothetical protein
MAFEASAVEYDRLPDAGTMYVYFRQRSRNGQFTPG